MIWLFVAIGGALGALARVATQRCCLHYFGEAHYGTLVVNMGGCLLMGIIMGITLKTTALSEPMRWLVVAGFLGSFTTFSAFSADTLALFMRGDHHLALIYIAASVILSLGAAYAGLSITRLVLA